LISGFLLFGLLITALTAAWIKLGLDDFNMLLTLAILCPPSLIVLHVSEIMNNNVGFIAIWLFIGVANAGLYSVVGAAIAGLLRKP
jgi:hypothetical protein